MNFEARLNNVGDDTDSESALAGFGEEDDRSARRRSWLFIAGAAVLILALWFFLHRGEAVDGSADKDKQAQVVSVFVPGRVTISGAINANGTLAARREMPVGVVGEGGQVVRTLAEAGDWVRAGQVLAVIDRSVQMQQQASQSAQIQVAEADARLAQSNLDRALKLVDRGFISKADVDRLTATRDAANARVGVARATLGQLRAQTARLNIVAPADGLLLERRVEPGQVVSPGTGVLFRIARDGEMEMKAMLGEVDMAKVSPGITAEVTPVGSSRQFTGQVWQVSPVIDPQTRQGMVRIALSYDPALRPGGFAGATIVAGTVVAPLLPDSAILSDNKGSYVYIVGEGNKVERRAIKTGIITDNGIAVVSGLTGKERIVLRAGGFLSPGETIKPVQGKQ